ncbi:MAG: hypothetical protein KF800_12235 [Lysobacter sp.]|nr:hypothetical protein [Lysobacter sp.]
MDSAELLREFGDATLALSAAVVLVFLLSRWLRPRFGAGVAYAAWWLVPAALLALLLPAPVADLPEAPLMPMAIPAAAAATTAAPVASFDPTPWLAALWLLGALAMALRLWWLQRRFERGLGRLRPLRDDLWKAQTSLGLPALLGVMRARIVLPDDFLSRYDARERQLMLAHERTHHRRGDHLANFAVVALRCVFWFNPLVHLAARFFRHDQELACDQAVIAAHPDSRRAYGEAMLKTLMADRQAPLGCHWGFSHPLKERVMQLKSPMPRPWARRIGAITVALLALGTGFAVWSAQPARAPKAVIQAGDLRGGDHRIDVALRIDGDEAERFAVVNPDGELLKLTRQDGKGGRIDVDATVRPLDGGRYDIAMALKRNGREISQPRLVVAEGTPATVKVGDDKADGTFAGVELVMVVADASRTPPPPPPAPPAPPAAPDEALPPVPPVPAMAPPAPPAAPAPLAPRAPKPSAVPPAPPVLPAPVSTARPQVSSERAHQAVRVHAGQAERARAEAVAAQAAAARHAAQSNADFEAGKAAAREAARAAAAAKDAEQAARAAEAAAFNVDAEAAERTRARYATMSPQEIEAELEATRQRIEKRRGELRAMAAEQAAREAARAPTPAAN